MAGTIRRGVINAAGVCVEIAKFLIPAVMLTTFLERSGWLKPVADAAAPLMGYIGLPGEASLALVLGNLSTPYAGVAVLSTLQLTSKQWTVAGAMLLLCHSAVVESGIVSKAGASATLVLLVRIAASVAVGLALNAIL